MQNQLLNEAIPEQTYTLPPTTQGELTTEATQDTQAVQQWLSNIQREARRDKSLLIFFQASIFLPIALIGFLPLMHDNHLYLTLLILLFLPVIGMTLMGLRAFLKKPGWNAEALARIGGVKAIGTLLDLQWAPKAPKQTTPLYAALTELLPRMKASDAATWTAEQRGILLWSLKDGTGGTTSPALYQNYRLAILKALEKIGDAAAIPVVEHLANGKVRTAHQKALQAAAMECLPLLRANSSDVDATKTLLRASAPENSAPETLLRPVESTPDANAKQLLHAADTPSPLPPVS
jgi:hypothetical protein